MHGTVHLEKTGWAQTACALAGATVLAAAAALVLVKLVPMEGLSLAVSVALIAYLVFRASYPFFSRLLPQKGEDGTPWRVEHDTLYLGEDAMALDAIRMVHCWPNRDALGHSLPGWVVNIETEGKNRVLRSLTHGDADASAQELYALVQALGYEAQWIEGAQ